VDPGDGAVPARSALADVQPHRGVEWEGPRAGAAGHDHAPGTAEVHRLGREVHHAAERGTAVEGQDVVPGVTPGQRRVARSGRPPADAQRGAVQRQGRRRLRQLCRHRPVGSIFRARVDVTEWLGDSQFAYIPYEAPEAITAQLRDLSRELDSEELRTQAIVSIDSTSRIREGREAEFWLDSRKVHVFDPTSGENLTRDAEAGAELTRMATQDRVEQVDEAKGGASRVGAA
jgi:hypothetical protein